MVARGIEPRPRPPSFFGDTKDFGVVILLTTPTDHLPIRAHRQETHVYSYEWGMRGRGPLVVRKSGRALWARSRAGWGGGSPRVFWGPPPAAV